MYYLGCDPGKTGALAILKDTEIVMLQPFDFMRYIDAVEFLSREQEATKAMVEQVHAMPKQGAVSMFTFGRNLGWIEGLLDMAGIPYQEIAPKTWKKEFGLNFSKDKPKAEIKAASIKACRQLFPTAELIPPRCRTPHDGIAEALLMAEYARRKL